MNTTTTILTIEISNALTSRLTAEKELMSGNHMQHMTWYS